METATARCLPDDAAATTDQRLSFHKCIAYDLARVKACAGVHPEWCDWFSAAHVPSALSKEMEEKRDKDQRTRGEGERTCSSESSASRRSC
ncbi:hypothetical protein M378DRAFT_166855 [Amanita muscaria Koide BX008]|uniref:Uncharacterized protein n=1 Tax=Amanita muscaria (strain Koide BX008) TaxID=946122 RepID=A0A0C2SEU3_AMAMK|nr:hypothetical protein M378DRAFT_166855 [Amanita muscaria Koide BX008]